MSELGRWVIGASLVLLAAPVSAQVPAPAARQVLPVTQPALPPATKLEGFTPVAGSVLTIGFDRLGRVGGVSVEVREMRDAKGEARGLVVEVREGQDTRERAYVDADEIAGLLKAVDAILGVRANPTAFRMFEVHYSTRGELQLAAFSDPKGDVSYSVQAGRIGTAQSILDAGEMLTLRGFLDAAVQKLNSIGPGK